MKKILALVIIITASLLSACNMPGSAAQPAEVNTEAGIDAPTAQPQPSGIPISFQNVNLVIPNGLASGANSELVPAADEANSDPWSVAPAYISFTLTGYTGQGASFDAVVRVYPAQEYASVNSWAASSYTRLQAVLANPAGPLTNDTLPTVPFNGAAAQEYAAQAKLTAFNGGAGVRMVSQYGQFPGPITKDNSFYHYEGLTNDGKYLVAILFPVALPLQSTADNPSADGVPFPSDPIDSAAMTSYYQGITDKLNAASAESFQPSLLQLDALIQTITVDLQ